MSDTQSEFVVDDSTQPGVLRQKLEQALALLKAKDDEITTLKTAEAQRTVSATWDELKVPDVIRKLYNGDTSPDAIKAWWNESQSLFNIQAAGDAPAVQQEPERPTPQELANQLAAQQFQQASSLGDNAYVNAFESAQKAAETAKTAYLNGQMSRADFDAARAKFYESQQTPTH